MASSSRSDEECRAELERIQKLAAQEGEASSSQSDEACRAQLLRLKKLATQVQEARERKKKLDQIKESVIQNLTDDELRQKYEDNFTWHEIRQQFKEGVPLGIEIPPPATFTLREKMEIEAAFHRSGKWVKKSDVPMYGTLKSFSDEIMMETRDACLASFRRCVQREQAFQEFLVKISKMREKIPELAEGVFCSMECLEADINAKLRLLNQKMAKVMIQDSPDFFELHEVVMKKLDEEEEILINEIKEVQSNIEQYRQCKSEEYDKILCKYIEYKGKLDLYKQIRSRPDKK